MYSPPQHVFSIRLTVRWMTGMLWPPSGDISCKWPPTSTNLTAFIEHCLNCMSFSVRVPVLSVNRYSTYQKTERVHVGTSVTNIIPKIHRVPEGHFIWWSVTIDINLQEQISNKSGEFKRLIKLFSKWMKIMYDKHCKF